MAAEATALTHLKAFLDAAGLPYALTSRVRRNEDLEDATVVGVECAYINCEGDMRKSHGETYFSFNTAGGLTAVAHYDPRGSKDTDR